MKAIVEFSEVSKKYRLGTTRDSLPSWLARTVRRCFSTVCVVPLAPGGGTRLKILEAMALGRPTVSATKGAEGLAVTAGENILITDGPAELGNAVLRPLANQELQAELG